MYGDSSRTTYHLVKYTFVRMKTEMERQDINGVNEGGLNEMNVGSMAKVRGSVLCY